MTDERIRRAPLLFCHIERQVLWTGSAAAPLSSSTLGASSLVLFEAILVMQCVVLCRKRLKAEQSKAGEELTRRGPRRTPRQGERSLTKQNTIIMLTRKSKGQYAFQGKPSICRGVIRPPGPGGGGVCALVTKICNRHGWRNSTHLYAEAAGRLRCSLGRSSGLLAAEEYLYIHGQQVPLTV